MSSLNTFEPTDYLTAYRSLSRRGTPRTAFEFARLLFALDPIGDPHGAAFHLDFLSVKAGMGQWLLDVWELWPEARKDIADNPLASHGIDVRCLPGWAYTRALILYDMESKKRETVSYHLFDLLTRP